MKYENKTIIELKDICKRRGIKGYSKLNKNELIGLINKHLSKTSKMGKTKSFKKMKGGDNSEPTLSVLTIMLFIGNNVQSSNKVQLNEFYDLNTIKAMKVDELRNKLIEIGYYKYPTTQQYFILKKLVELKEKNNTNLTEKLKEILNAGNKLLRNNNNQIKNNGSRINTPEKDELYRTYKLYKKYKSYIDNNEFKDGNEPELVVALDNSIIYSTKPFISKLLQDQFKEIYTNNYTNNRNEALKLQNNNEQPQNQNENEGKVYTVEGTVQNTNQPRKTGWLGWLM